MNQPTTALRPGQSFQGCINALAGAEGPSLRIHAIGDVGVRVRIDRTLVLLIRVGRHGSRRSRIRGLCRCGGRRRAAGTNAVGIEIGGIRARRPGRRRGEHRPVRRGRRHRWWIVAVGRERRPCSKRIRLTAQAESLRLPPKLKRDYRHRRRSRRCDGTAATVTTMPRPHIFELSNRAN